MSRTAIVELLREAVELDELLTTAIFYNNQNHRLPDDGWPDIDMNLYTFSRRNQQNILALAIALADEEKANG